MSTKNGNPEDAGQETDLQPFTFSAFSALVAAHAGQITGSVEGHWGRFTQPTWESAAALVSAQNLLASAAERGLNQTVESIRFTNLGRVNLRREVDSTGKGFVYKLQIVKVVEKGSPITEEHLVPLPVIVTAIRGNISLLAMALANDAIILARVKELMIDEEDKAKLERADLEALIEDAKTPDRPRRNTI